jgi:hypothetical protein
MGLNASVRGAIAAVTAALLGALTFPGQAAATTADRFFNDMSEDEETAYILTMARAAERALSEAGKPEVARRVGTLFPRTAKPGDDGGAIEDFKQAVDAFEREELVRQARGEASRDGAFLVEEMMVRALHGHGIDVPASFMAAAKAGKFRPATARTPPSGAPTAGTPLSRVQEDPCQVLTAAEARSAMGVAMEFKAHEDSTCKYDQVGFSDKAPNNRTLWLVIRRRPQANPNAVTDQLGDFRRYYSPPPLSITRPTDIGDTAIWAWRGDVGGELYAYSGGVLQIQVWIRGLPQPRAYAAARSLALKALGGAGRTGFAYACVVPADLLAQSASPPRPRATTETAKPPFIVHNPDGTITVQKGARQTGAVRAGLVIPPQVIVPTVHAPGKQAAKSGARKRTGRRPPT